MKRITSGSLGIVRGSRILFSDFVNDGPMWAGEGPRESRQIVIFPEPFAEAPEVMVSISLWDFDQRTNTRADISAENVTARGFQMVFRTWGDTRVARVRADWLALGAVHSEDNWDIR